MRISEKFTVIASFATTALFSGWILTKKSKTPKVEEVISESIADKRKRLVNDPNMRILDNKMSYLYLQGYEGSAKNLILLKDALDLAKPQIIALQLSEKDYDQEYQDVVKHPKFYEVMFKIDQLIKSKDEEQLNNMPEIDISKGIENLYLISYCNQIGCKVLFADEPNETYQTMFQSKLRLKTLTNDGKIPLPEQYRSEFKDYDLQDLSLSESDLNHKVFKLKRAEVFVNKVLVELKPKISIIPDTPYKMIVGLVNKTSVDDVVECWKTKFQNAYGQQMNEDKGGERIIIVQE